MRVRRKSERKKEGRGRELKIPSPTSKPKCNEKMKREKENKKAQSADYNKPLYYHREQPTLQFLKL